MTDAASTHLLHLSRQTAQQSKRTFREVSASKRLDEKVFSFKNPRLIRFSHVLPSLAISTVRAVNIVWAIFSLSKTIQGLFDCFMASLRFKASVRNPFSLWQQQSYLFNPK